MVVLALEDSEVAQEHVSTVVDDEEKIRDLKREILGCFKFIADMAYFDLIPLSSLIEVSRTLVKDYNTFLNFGKIVLVICGLQKQIFSSP